jgi:hypothetical protein
MERRRTPWMSALGIMDIVIGALGLVFVSVILSGWVGLTKAMETIDSSLEAAGNRQFFTEQASTLAAKAGDEFHQAYAFFLLDGIASGIFAMSLIVLGIGTLRLASWARMMSIVWSLLYLIWFVVLSVLEPVDFDELGVLLLLYPITVLYLFNTRQWKMIFRRVV